MRLQMRMRESPGLLEESESACSKNLVESTATDECARLGQNSRIHCGVKRLSSPNSSGVSSHACVSFLDALLVAPARAPAALTAARRVASFSAVVGLGMHDDGLSVHDASSNPWSDTVRVYRVPQAQGGYRRWGFWSGLRFASCLRGGGRGKFSTGRRCTAAGCRFTSQEATRHRYQARSREVWSHLPSTRRFLVSDSCHVDADWTSGNQWAGRRCVEPHVRGFGC